MKLMWTFLDLEISRYTWIGVATLVWFIHHHKLKSPRVSPDEQTESTTTDSKLHQIGFCTKCVKETRLPMHCDDCGSHDRGRIKSFYLEHGEIDNICTGCFHLARYPHHCDTCGADRNGERILRIKGSNQWTAPWKDLRPVGFCTRCKKETRLLKHCDGCGGHSRYNIVVHYIKKGVTDNICKGCFHLARLGHHCDTCGGDSNGTMIVPIG